MGTLEPVIFHIKTFISNLFLKEKRGDSNGLNHSSEESKHANLIYYVACLALKMSLGSL
jgi:hypothetical protein